MKLNLKLEEINLDNIIVNTDCLDLIPYEIAIKFNLFPFDNNANYLSVAICTQIEQETINLLKLISKKEIRIYLAQKDQVIDSINRYYEKASAEWAIEKLKLEKKDSFLLKDSNSKENVTQEDSPLIKLVDSIINQAILMKASDIHLEPNEDNILIRYRKDGVLTNFFTIPSYLYNPVSTRIKVMCEMNIAEKRYPQDGKYQCTIQGNNYDFRVSSLPTIHGEKFVIRILYKSLYYCNLENINFSQAQRTLINKILNFTHGMILVTGPTGCGKSTTLHAMLNRLNSTEKNITTIEDPIEYKIRGVNQVNVNKKSGMSFAVGLRSILRQDPDYIGIGEIRDSETASIAVRAAITGHLVLSTLHTNSSIGTINRLVEMGIPRYLLSDSLIAVISQRLVRKICPYCKTEYTPSSYEKEILNLNSTQSLFKGGGCNKCFQSGFSGRTSVCEVLYINDFERELILKDFNSNVMKKHCINKGMEFMIDGYKKLILQGISTFDEMIKSCNGEF
jgi:type IV pilus assembly protein PilB